MKRKFAALALTLATMIAATPMSVFAESQTVDVSETDSFAVSASASVTEQELADLGLNLIVSFPTEIALSLNEDKEFVGSDKIYAYGILDPGNILSVTIDYDSTAYGKVMYRSVGSLSGGMEAEDNYRANVTTSLSKTSFTASETQENYLKRENGEEMSGYSTLSVTIANLLPSEGKGVYFTNVPLKLEIM